jgi:trimeric autotransporter adhesin
MQALLLSLDEQHGGMGATEGAGGPSNDAGPSSSGGSTAAAHLPRDDGHNSPGCGGSSGSGDAGAVHDAGHLSAGMHAAASAAAPAECSQPSASSAAQSGSSASESADVPDAELLAHAARLAERATLQQPRQPSNVGVPGDLHAADGHSSASSADASAWPATAASSNATVAYVRTASPAASSVGSESHPDEGDVLEAHGQSGCGSAVLADALADAPGWPTAEPDSRTSRLTSSNSSNEAGTPAGIGSTALAQALAAANGWGSPSAAQAAAAQRPPFLGVVMVQAAAHIQHPTDPLTLQPACRCQGAQAAHAAAPSRPQACAAGPDGAAVSGCGNTEACSTEALPEAGGAALLLQPDGTSLLVLLTNPAAVAAAAAASVAGAALPPEVAQGAVAAAGVPLYEIDCEVHSM